jgi:hypothetical protein
VKNFFRTWEYILKLKGFYSSHVYGLSNVWYLLNASCDDWLDLMLLSTLFILDHDRAYGVIPQPIALAGVVVVSLANRLVTAVAPGFFVVVGGLVFVFVQGLAWFTGGFFVLNKFAAQVNAHKAQRSPMFVVDVLGFLSSLRVLFV